MKYRKKPVVIEAIQWNGDNLKEVMEFIGSEFKYESNTRYITIASDGVWEFLSNEAVMKIANKYYESNDPIGLCDAVVAEATRWWEKEDVVIDDITIVTIFY